MLPEEPPPEQGGVATVAPPAEEPSVSDTEADEMEEHLRGLGYLE